jgi:CMP-N-acetylneuraminic acid synthetase
MRPLLGKPLINHTVDVARECFDEVIVSSDTDEILEIVPRAANVLTVSRPQELATDQSKVIDTVIYHFEQSLGDQFDQIWLCLPTCPLRTSDDILEGQNLLSDAVDGVLSLTDYEFPPSLGLVIRDGLVHGFDPTHPLANGNSRSQDHIGTYRPNGAFYGMWWASFHRHRNFYRGKIRGCHMPRERSIDIDTDLDFALAEIVLRMRKEVGNGVRANGA